MNGDLNLTEENSVPQPEDVHQIRSLKELLDQVTGRTSEISSSLEEGNSGLLEPVPYPFMALVGQQEMKLALMIALINPAVGGVLLLGPRGTGKTTAVRSLVPLLPPVFRSACHYGCLPEDIEEGGIDAVCPDCARKYAEGQPLTLTDSVRMVELPLNSRLEDVVGGLDEHSASHERFRIHRGILAQADRNILYIDEVNLLSDDIIDAILDASAQGRFTLRRGLISATYHSRYILIGSMNPEEGYLRPQIMDRFGLRVIVQGLPKPEQRLEAYRRASNYIHHPRRFSNDYRDLTWQLQQEITAARGFLEKVVLTDEMANIGVSLSQQLKIDSMRAEITLFESARALAAADGRTEVSLEDLRTAAPMALRLRKSTFMNDYISSRKDEEEEIVSALNHKIQSAPDHSQKLER
jgi:magnesium chelatase subunit I